MKYNLILLAFFSLLLFSCGEKKNKKKINYKFKIEGKVRTITSNHQSPLVSNSFKKDTVYVEAIAYTDTIHGQTADSIWYFNSDGSKLTVYSPYSVTNIK